MVNQAVSSLDSQPGKSGVTDPGAVDNRLTLDPGDSRWSEKLAEWKDGEDYTVTLKVRQISPGELEVTGMEGADDSEPAEPEAAAEEEMPAKGGKVNKAVATMEE